MHIIPPDNELPHRLRESTFRQFEPLIRRAIDQATAGDPSPVSVNPAPLRCTTYAARLRDSIAAFKRYQWPSSFTLFDLTTANLNVRHTEVAVYIGPKGKAWTAPHEFQVVDKNRTSGLPIDVELNNEQLIAFCRLLSDRLLAGPVILRTQVLAQGVIDLLESQFDVAIEISEQFHSYHMSEIKERMLHQLLNPYQMDQLDMARIQVWVDPSDKYLLTSVYPIRGVETLLLSGIYKRICEQLRKENITSYTPSNARRVHEIILSYITALPIGGTGPIENVSGGTDSVPEPRSNPADQPADVRKTTPRGLRNGGGKRSSRKKA